MDRNLAKTALLAFIATAVPMIAVPTIARGDEAPWLGDTKWVERSIQLAAKDRSTQSAGVRLVFSYGAYPYYASPYAAYGPAYRSYYGYPSYHGPWIGAGGVYSPYAVTSYYYPSYPRYYGPVQYGYNPYFAPPVAYVVRGHRSYRGCCYW